MSKKSTATASKPRVAMMLKLDPMLRNLVQTTAQLEERTIRSVIEELIATNCPDMIRAATNRAKNWAHRVMATNDSD